MRLSVSYLAGQACGALLAATLATAAVAQPATPTPNSAVLDLQKMLDNMGYSTKISGAYITFNDSNYVLALTTSDDKTVAYLSITYSVPQDKVAKIPMKDLLSFNDSHKRYFSMMSNSSTTQVSLNDQFATAGANARAIRIEVEGIVGDANTMQDLFNPTRYK